MRTIYNVRTGVTQIKSKARKLTNRLAFSIVTLFAVLGAALIPATSADTGGYCSASANGCEAAAAAGAQCGTGAGSGAFGALGKYNNEAGGANGQATGRNNSAVCGNRQGNL